MSANINNGNWASGKQAQVSPDRPWGKQAPSPDPANGVTAPVSEPGTVSDNAEQVKNASGWVTGPNMTPTDQFKKQTESKPKVARRIKLKTVTDVKAELARIYRASVTGELDVNAATKLAYMLQVQSKFIETSDIERRIAELESQNGK